MFGRETFNKMYRSFSSLSSAYFDSTSHRFYSIICPWSSYKGEIFKTSIRHFLERMIRIDISQQKASGYGIEGTFWLGRRDWRILWRDPLLFIVSHLFTELDHVTNISVSLWRNLKSYVNVGLAPEKPRQLIKFFLHCEGQVNHATSTTGQVGRLWWWYNVLSSARNLNSDLAQI